MHFLVLALRTPDFDPDVLPPHRAYLETLNARGLLAGYGLFRDQSGGAYIVRTDSLTEAEAVAARAARRAANEPAAPPPVVRPYGAPPGDAKWPKGVEAARQGGHRSPDKPPPADRTHARTPLE